MALMEGTNNKEQNRGDISGRPEGVDQKQWNNILEKARTEVLAEKTRSSKPGDLIETDSEDLPVIGNGIGKSSHELTAVLPVDKSAEGVRREILEKALNMLDNKTSGSKAGQLDIKNSDGVADFVDQLISKN